MTTPTGPSSSGAIGTLLGTKPLQKALNRLADDIEKLGSSAGLSSRTDVNAKPAQQWASRAWFGKESPYSPNYRPQSGGAPIGGNATFSQTSRNTGQKTTYTVPGAMPYSGGNGAQSPNGGFQRPRWQGGQGAAGGHGGAGSYTPVGSSGGGGSGGSGGGLKGLWNDYVGMGNRMMPDQMAMDSYVTWATVGQNSVASRNDARRAAFGMNNGNINGQALNQADAQRGEMLTMRTTGGNSLSGGGATMRSGMNMLNLTNPTMGMGDAGQSMQNLYSTQGYFRMQQLGLGKTMIGGKQQSMASMADNIIRRTGTSKWSAKDMQTSMADNGIMGYSVRQLPLDAAGQESMKQMLVGVAKAHEKGMSTSEYEKLSNDVASGNSGRADAAWNKLKPLGMRRDSFMATKTKNATDLSRQADVNDSFSTSVSQATDALTSFSGVLNEIMKLPGVKELVGNSGGASVLNSGISALKSMPGVGGMIGNGLGMVSSLIGQGATAQVASTTSRAKSTSSSGSSNVQNSGGLSWQRALSIAETQTGKPYHWGGHGPDVFDCSGLWYWVMQQMGVKNPPRTVADQDKAYHNTIKTVAEAKPGDFLVEHKGNRQHIEMYLGNGKTFGAHQSGTKVGTVSQWSGYDHAISMFSGTGSGSATLNNTGSSTLGNTQTGGGDTGGGGIASVSSGYGSVEEVDALMSALASTGVTSGGGSSTDPTATAASATATALPPNNGKVDTTGNNIGNMALGKQLAAKYGWGSGAEWNALVDLWTGESHWNNLAKNPNSGAFGIPQALGHGTSRSRGKYSNEFPVKAANDGDPTAQINWGLDYIKKRKGYGDPLKADAFKHAHNWYDKGAWEIKQDELAQIHQGEMVISPKGADTVRAAMLKDALYASPGPTSSVGGSGSGGGHTLTFNQGSVVISVQGSMTPDAAKKAAQVFADQLAQTNLLDKIASGVTTS